jgi:serpin B
MNEHIHEALNEISEAHIAEAAKKKKRKGAIFLRIVAAAAMLAIVIGIFQLPKPINAKAVSLADDCRVPARPESKDYDNIQDWRKDYDVWSEANAARSESTKLALSGLQDFFTEANSKFLSGNDNAVWSPVNAYIGLAMVAELTEGNSRQQILDLLGTANTTQLRTQVSAVWESAYKDGNEASHLANSLWLQKGLSYRQDTMDALSYHYYADVYQTNLKNAGGAIGAWLNNQTGGFLRDAKATVPEDAVLALYSTLYFQSKWSSQFNASNNTKDVFHAPSGDTTVTYMNKKLAMMDYYYGDCFSAVRMGLKNGSSMWFILPDEGYTPADVLADGQYMDMLLGNDWENVKYMKVNLSVPKFDVSGKQDLAGGLKEMGVTDVFDLNTSNFSAITADTPIYLTAANQAVRVQIDEEGVKAAAYIEFPGAGSPAPPEEIIDFILDRPFLFVISNDNIPLFAGVVNEP